MIILPKNLEKFPFFICISPKKRLYFIKGGKISKKIVLP